MPLISEFPIAGPQGKQGPVGPEGKQGPEGKRGPMGPAGPGTGDMLAMVYDPQGKAIDVYKYTDDAAAGRADLTLSNLSNKQKALRNIGGMPNRNLLDNWYFAGGGSQQGGGQLPINQRGQTSYTSGYTIDRWFTLEAAATTVSVESGGVRVAKTNSGGAEMFAQIFDQSVRTAILGKTITFSAIVNGTLGTQTITMPSNVESGIDNIEFHVDGLLCDIFKNPNGELRIRFHGGAGSWLISAVKLELGDHQTLAYQDEEGNWVLNEIPDYGEELAKCRRYFQRIKASSSYMRFGVSMPYSSTLAGVFISLLGEMRKTPIVSFGGNFALFDVQNYYPVTLALDTPSPYNATLIASGSTQPTRAANLLAYNDSTAYIDFSADL